MAVGSGGVLDMVVDAPVEVSYTKLLWRLRCGEQRGEWSRRLDWELEHSG
jgi:hypothetical protein